MYRKLAATAVSLRGEDRHGQPPRGFGEAQVEGRQG